MLSSLGGIGFPYPVRRDLVRQGIGVPCPVLACMGFPVRKGDAQNSRESLERFVARTSRPQ